MYKIFNATQRLDIYLFSASRKRMLPFLVSRAYASSNKRVMATPYFFVVRFTWALTEEIILSLFQRLYGTHHENAGSSEIPWEVANYATSIGLYYFITDIGIHFLMRYFQGISKFHPTVDFLHTTLA